MHTQTLFQLFNAFEDYFATQLAIDNVCECTVVLKIEQHREYQILNFEKSKLILEIRCSSDENPLAPETVNSLELSVEK